MDADLAYLRTRVPAYADYEDEDARHLVDKQVRAYVGEALSKLRERLGKSISGEQEEELENVLLMCEFTNQQFVHIIDHALLSNDDVEHLHTVDRELIEEAEKAGSIEPAALLDYLKAIAALFARRAKAVFAPAA